MSMRSILNENIEGKRIIIRADLNVPIKDGKILDSTRIKRFCSGIKPLVNNGAIITILSHLGRPKGKVDPSLSLAIIKNILSKYLNTEVFFSNNCIGDEVITINSLLSEGSVMLCENLRFHPEEEINSPTFAKKLSTLGEIYVNDAFSCSHRAHSSIEAITKFIPAYAGPLLNDEIKALESALNYPKKPAIAIIGGAKVSTKISVLKNLVKSLDGIIIGGGMANTFLFAKGASMGKSLFEKDLAETASEIIEVAKKENCKVYLPTDIVVSKEFKEDSIYKTLPFNQCPKDYMILDAGLKSLINFKIALSNAKTILWNGPLGAFEISPFDKATVELAKTAAKMTQEGKCISVAGGGDTISALKTAGVINDFTYVSSAGGAFLEWLEGRKLPGIKALEIK